MQISLDPMPALRERAVQRVNAHFDALAFSHRSLVHERKRIAAVAVLAQQRAPVDFAAEAEMRSLTVQEFAELIAAKIDALGDRELKRQRMMLDISTASTPTALALIVDMPQS